MTRSADRASPAEQSARPRDSLKTCAAGVVEAVIEARRRQNSSPSRDQSHTSTVKLEG